MSNRCVALYLLIAAVCALSLQLGVRAGPGDQGTKYPVGIGIGTFNGSGIVDSGGTTTLSFADAKAAGLLDANGDPVNPPAGSRTLGGTGGGSVRCHVFNNVPITITPRNADGTPNGAPRTVNATVYVPKKPADQNPPDQEKKTNSVATKLGANIVGATIGGGKLDLIDTPNPATPNTNTRSTGWTNPDPPTPPEPPPPPPPVPTPSEKRVPIRLSDGIYYIRPMIGPLGFVTDVFIGTAPVTLIPYQHAGDCGFVQTGSLVLPRDIHAALFTEGYLDTLPDNGPLVLFSGYLPDIALPTDDPAQPYAHIHNVAACINPQSEKFLFGANACIPYWPNGSTAWLDPENELLHIAESALSIGEAKHMPDGALVNLAPKHVTAGTNDFGTMYYIEEMSRACGIAVRPAMAGMMVPRDGLVSTTGTMATMNGERVIVNAATEMWPYMYPMPAIAMENIALGGGNMGTYVHGVTGGFGLNNIGLLVRTSGRMTGEVGPDYFVINDGSIQASESGEINQVRVKIGEVGPGNMIMPPMMPSYVGVTGLSSTEYDGINVIRVIRPRNQDDIVVYSAPH